MFIMRILSVYPVIQYMEGDILLCCFIVLISLDPVVIIMTHCILLTVLLILLINRMLSIRMYVYDCIYVYIVVQIDQACRTRVQKDQTCRTRVQKDQACRTRVQKDQACRTSVFHFHKCYTESLNTWLMISV